MLRGFWHTARNGTPHLDLMQSVVGQPIVNAELRVEHLCPAISERQQTIHVFVLETQTFGASVVVSRTSEPEMYLTKLESPSNMLNLKGSHGHICRALCAVKAMLAPYACHLISRAPPCPGRNVRRAPWTGSRMVEVTWVKVGR